MEGYIKLHRLIIDHWVFDDPEALKLWIFILSSASWKGSKRLVCGKLIDQELGQLITGRTKLSERLNISIEELKEKLNDFACRGIIFRAEGRTAVRYALRDSLFMIYRMPGWKGENDELNRKLAPLLNQYYTEVYGEEFLGHPTQGLRAIPINQTIKDPSTIMPYEDIVKVIDNFKYFTVATCACRLRKNLDPTFGTKYCVNMKLQIAFILTCLVNIKFKTV